LQYFGVIPEEVDLGPNDSSGAPYLTDQFGERYEAFGGLGLGVGSYPIFFQPVGGAAASHGARLTLHLPVGNRDGQTSFDLNVDLSGALAPKAAQSIPAPGEIVDSGRHVT
jgi:hypothetical protein